LNDNSSRPGADFSKDFYKEFAVGVGYGLRLDFSFLIVRIDAALKTVDPSRELGKRYVLPEFSFNSPFTGTNSLNFVIGIGHPF
jgi:outer membrane protein insertion porin family